MAEAAARIGVTQRVIHLRIRAGVLPATKLPGATTPYLIDPDVVEYMAGYEAGLRDRKAKRAARRAARAPSTAA